jgi:hypothetical protein
MARAVIADSVEGSNKKIPLLFISEDPEIGIIVLDPVWACGPAYIDLTIPHSDTGKKRGQCRAYFSAQDQTNDSLPWLDTAPTNLGVARIG